MGRYGEPIGGLRRGECPKTADCEAAVSSHAGHVSDAEDLSASRVDGEAEASERVRSTLPDEHRKYRYLHVRLAYEFVTINHG